MSDEISQTRRNLFGPDEMIIVSRATEKMLLEGKIFKKFYTNAWPVLYNGTKFYKVAGINGTKL